jgi:hypothetical protein
LIGEAGVALPVLLLVLGLPSSQILLLGAARCRKRLRLANRDLAHVRFCALLLEPSLLLLQSLHSIDGVDDLVLDVPHRLIHLRHEQWVSIGDVVRLRREQVGRAGVEQLLRLPTRIIIIFLIKVLITSANDLD